MRASLCRVVAPRPASAPKQAASPAAKRRKKCDERKPLCHTCERLQLECNWEDQDNERVDRRLSPRPSPSRETSTRIVAHQFPNPLGTPPKQLPGHSPFSSTHDQSLFNFFSLEILPSLMRKHVHPAYLDQTPLYAIACSCPWVMNSMLALSRHHLSWLQSRNGDPAVPYYARAVRDLRRNMSSMSADDDSLLSTITFLGLYEELRSDNFSHNMIHFNSSSQILKTHMAGRNEDKSIFLRIHAESAMYHLSTRAVFAESLPDERHWHQLQQYLSMPPLSGAAEWTESPLLGSIPQLFALILETTRLSRAVPLNDALMEKAKAYLDEIQEDKLRLAAFKSRLSAEYDELEPTMELEVYGVPWLYLLALEIFLFKIMGPVTTHVDRPEIQKRTEEAHALFRTAPFLPVHDETRFGPDPTYPLTESNCWPLMIIGCATTREEHIVTLKAVFLNLWRVRYSGYVRKVIRVVDAAWKTNRAYCESRNALSAEAAASTSAPASTVPLHGLDVLLRSQGRGWGSFS